MNGAVYTMIVKMLLDAFAAYLAPDWRTAFMFVTFVVVDIGSAVVAYR